MDKQFYFNPLDLACKSIVGGISTNENLDIFVKAEGITACTIKLKSRLTATERDIAMRVTDDGFALTLVGLEVGYYTYCFLADDEIYGVDNEFNAKSDCIKPFWLTVYSDDYSTPDWIKGGIIYQIFPDRFSKHTDEFFVSEGKVKRSDWDGLPNYENEAGEVLNNEFFGGSFLGILNKLDYLKDLNINCIYLNPINKAFSSHRYDTADYLSFDDILGSEADLEQLIKKADELNIKIIFDGVYNHTGADSIYFNKFSSFDEIGAYNFEQSPYHEWYSFREFPENYDCWWGFENLPSIKKDSLSYQEFIINVVIPRNLSLGFYGVRLDVVDELSDDFVSSIRKAIKSRKTDAFIVGEVWEDATSKVSYGEIRRYFLGKSLDSVMNYPLRGAIINYVQSSCADELCYVVRSQINNFPPSARHTLMNVLSTHDTPRIISVLGADRLFTDKRLMKDEILTSFEYDRGVRLSKIAYSLIFTLYGVPCLYYGDEAGMHGNLDPYNRKPFPWGNEDKELSEFIRKIAELRVNNEVFKRGECNILYSQNGVFVFERTYEDKQIIVAVSRCKKDVFLNFSNLMLNLLTEESNRRILLRQDEVIIAVRA